MNELSALRKAEAQAAALFQLIETEGLIRPGKSEKQLNEEIYQLAAAAFGIRKYWHKRIVRAGANTLLPYRENPPNLILQEDDIVFFDFGPVFEEWEADFGRSYVLGNNPRKKQLVLDSETAWSRGKAYYEARKTDITASELYQFTCTMAAEMGWEYGNEHCGHLIGNFPHEKIIGDEQVHYLHPENDSRLLDRSAGNHERYWIYEIHFVDRELRIGAFFEQLLS